MTRESLVVWGVARGPLAAHGIAPDTSTLLRQPGIISDAELTIPTGAARAQTPRALAAASVNSPG
jgi:hypothetical protein